MIGGPARWMAVLAFAAAAQAAAAGDRFVPNDPAFVVANIKQVMPDEKLRALVGAWRAEPAAEGAGGGAGRGAARTRADAARTFVCRPGGGGARRGS